jgi:acetylglutamate kinase
MLEAGIGAIHIVGIAPPDAILREAETPGAAGTAFVAGRR